MDGHQHDTAARGSQNADRQAECVVVEPPQVSRHPELPSVQLAGTILRVTAARPADFPGLPATIDETVEVNVAIPTSYAQAEGLYRQGNRVRIVGQLDCRMERQAGPSVATKLAASSRPQSVLMICRCRHVSRLETRPAAMSCWSSADLG